MSRRGLTPTMLSAVRLAKELGGGRLTRYPGGLWCAGERDQLVYFGTSTIKALVDRGVARYTRWQQGRNGEFPVEATIIEAVIA